MAGSGKTCYVRKLVDVLKSNRKKVYVINLDPAVTKIHYKANIDIRDSINYRQIMKKYNLGPNGAIMTSLNIFVTRWFTDKLNELRFDKILELLDKRSEVVDYIILDTPGQIEVFNWSASGTIILGSISINLSFLESLSSSFPTMVNYLIDTTRSQNPITFMTNMIYACSVMYKCQLPFVASFNKIGNQTRGFIYGYFLDVNRHEVCLDWMSDYEKFYEAVTHDETYMASLSRSCALMLNEFYMNIKCCGISCMTGEGFEEHVKLLDECVDEYNR
ncbi:uncharacterized protein TA16325 [Theileria annulata]|uniref:GPN-loop GTPase n=1 Tax=Theileria annulata TaxID=5874 RepID=Q4UIU4_THEAN|nr:uncharacterized protein TA16325 [Theileria annulata]CAI72995.1 hypothetical protein, conserved [Theileria annulata]|eukprot:XP_953673.1 hypothetical protein, conserved [Theileria annulata]